MIALVSPPDKGGRRGTTDRASYLIDRFRVTYDFGGGWSCGCREFALRDWHLREAKVRQRTDPRPSGAQDRIHHVHMSQLVGVSPFKREVFFHDRRQSHCNVERPDRSIEGW